MMRLVPIKGYRMRHPCLRNCILISFLPRPGTEKGLLRELVTKQFWTSQTGMKHHSGLSILLIQEKYPIQKE